MPVIRLKRGVGAPSSLQYGEPAVDLTNHRLYLGGQSNTVYGYNLGGMGFYLPRSPEGHDLFARPRRDSHSNDSRPDLQHYSGDKIKFFAFLINNFYQVKRIVFRVYGPLNQQVTILAGVYNTSTSTSPQNFIQPGTLLGSVSHTFNIGSPAYVEANLNLDLPPGVYWLGLKSGDSNTVRLFATHDMSLRWCIGWSATMNESLVGYSINHTVGDPLPTQVSQWNSMDMILSSNGITQLRTGAPTVLFRCYTT